MEIKTPSLLDSVTSFPVKLKVGKITGGRCLRRRRRSRLRSRFSSRRCLRMAIFSLAVLGRALGAKDSPRTVVGRTDGLRVGAKVGAWEAIVLGLVDGDMEGFIDATCDGSMLIVGTCEGIKLGSVDGNTEGMSEASGVGTFDGCMLGDWDGYALGCSVGSIVGPLLAVTDGK